MRLMTSSRACECRHMKPTPTLRFFCSATSAAFNQRRTAGPSVANDFSANTFTPFPTAYSKCIGRKAACVVSNTTSSGPRESIAFL